MQLVKANDDLFGSLRDSSTRIGRARSYLERPDCNPLLGLAYLERTRLEHGRLLARLRANRLEACRLLGLDTSEAEAS